MRELIAAVEAVNGAPLKVNEAPRRAGDPPSLVAEAQRIRDVLGWHPQHDSLEAIVTSSLNWERRIAARDPAAYWRD